MRVLFIGDIFGSIGRRILAENLKNILTENNAEICIANCENVAGGKGITLNIIKKLRKYGVNIITGGNHSMANEAVYNSISPVENLLRPLNFINETRGEGKLIYELPNGKYLGVINLLGRTFFEKNLECPFKIGLSAVNEMAMHTSIIIIDFHAEATSEKICLANYLNGKVSAVLGTHTHVQTADERILSKGTAFITDVGMTGPEDSAIGMKFKQVIDKFINDSHVRFEPASQGPMFNGVIVDIDNESGKAKSIHRVFKRLSFN